MPDPSPERNSAGKLERLLFFITPIIFTAILLGVLLTLFNIDISGGIKKAVSEIPLVKKIWPEAVLPEEDTQANEGLTAEASEKIIRELKQRLADKEAALIDAEQHAEKGEHTIIRLQEELEELRVQMQTKQQADRDYDEHLRELSAMYGKLSPAKAAKVMEQLAPDDQVLLLSGMKSDERRKVLERMDPKQAADATVRLKETVTAENLQVAALQARVKQLEEAVRSNSVETTSDKEIALSIAGMPPKNAAGLLLALAKSNRNQALSLLNSMNTQARSAILTAMSEQSQTETVKLASEWLSK